MEAEDWPSYKQMTFEGPWENPLSVVGDSLPRSAAQTLDLARSHGWGIGPITLVMRLNHPSVPPFFMRWDYAHETGRWGFWGARARNGQKLTVPDCRLVIQHPDALFAEEPDVYAGTLRGNGKSSTQGILGSGIPASQ